MPGHGVVITTLIFNNSVSYVRPIEKSTAGCFMVCDHLGGWQLLEWMSQHFSGQPLTCPNNLCEFALSEPTKS